MLYRGACKCGAVAFEAEGEIESLMDCNCSICRPKGYLHWFVPQASFRLQTSAEAMGGYRFNKRSLHHRFCKACGCSPFVEGPGTVAVNARCLQDFDLTSVPIKPYDGAHI